MDDTLGNKPSTVLLPPSAAMLWICGFAVASLAGCSLFVMAGKAIFGDPKVECAFTRQTHVNLVKAKKKLVVVLSFPESARGEYASIGADIVESVTLRLKREGVRVVKSDKVYDWLNDNGDRLDDIHEFAKAFDADYIVHIELEEFAHRAANSPGMYQGRTLGEVHTYKIVTEDGEKRARRVFRSEFRSVYPPNNPISVSRKSENTFLREYVQRISIQLAQYFYNHHMGETIF